MRASQELRAGRHHEHFVVDMIQGGAGTSTNMNANEVIANRALELKNRTRGDYAEVHPNNHVNLSQSTNDVYPTAVKIALHRAIEALRIAMAELAAAFLAKGEEFSPHLKMGRTQLQDAVPMTLGQEFTRSPRAVAEGMGGASGHKNERLGTFRALCRAEDERDFAVQHVVSLFAIDVNVRRWHAAAGRKGAFHEREAATGCGGPRLEMHDAAPGFLAMAFAGAEHIIGVVRHVPMSFLPQGSVIQKPSGRVTRRRASDSASAVSSVDSGMPSR